MTRNKNTEPSTISSLIFFSKSKNIYIYICLLQDILNILEYTFNLIYLTLLFFIKYFHNIIISYKNKHLTNLIIVN